MFPRSNKLFDSRQPAPRDTSYAADNQDALMQVPTPPNHERRTQLNALTSSSPLMFAFSPSLDASGRRATQATGVDTFESPRTPLRSGTVARVYRQSIDQTLAASPRQAPAPTRGRRKHARVDALDHHLLAVQLASLSTQYNDRLSAAAPAPRSPRQGAHSPTPAQSFAQKRRMHPQTPYARPVMPNAPRSALARHHSGDISPLNLGSPEPARATLRPCSEPSSPRLR